MSVKIHIELELDGEPTTTQENAILRALGAGGEWPSSNDKPAAPKPEPKPAAKKAAKPKPAPKPEPEEDKAGEDDEDGPVLSDAVKVATKMVSEGKAGELKDALTSIGVKRVSELSGGQIAEFLAALE